MPTTTTRDEHLIQPARPGRSIIGWGADANPADRPAVPKEKPSTVMTPRGDVPERQKQTVRIFKSTEHPDLTPVFGTTCPPSGLSGKIREVAYTMSEGRKRHWLLLLLADRVNVVEGLLDDITNGVVPNFLEERGTATVLRYRSADRFLRNKTAIYSAIGLAVAAAALAAAAQSRRR